MQRSWRGSACNEWAAARRRPWCVIDRPALSRRCPPRPGSVASGTEDCVGGGQQREKRRRGFVPLHRCPLAPCPGRDHLGSVQRIAVAQLGEVSDSAEAAPQGHRRAPPRSYSDALRGCAIKVRRARVAPPQATATPRAPGARDPRRGRHPTQRRSRRRPVVAATGTRCSRRRRPNLRASPRGVPTAAGSASAPCRASGRR